MLLQRAYLGITNLFALPRLLAVRNRDREIEVLALVPVGCQYASPSCEPGFPGIPMKIRHRLYTFIWIDALTRKVREGGRTVNVHCLVVSLPPSEAYA